MRDTVDKNHGLEYYTVNHLINNNVYDNKENTQENETFHVSADLKICMHSHLNKCV